MQQIILTLPESVPPPKYQMFQKVEGGEIVGLEYTSPGIALAERLPACGWYYAVRRVSGIGLPIEEVVGVIAGKDLDQNWTHEEDIEVLEVCGV